MFMFEGFVFGVLAIWLVFTTIVTFVAFRAGFPIIAIQQEYRLSHVETAEALLSGLAFYCTNKKLPMELKEFEYYGDE